MRGAYSTSDLFASGGARKAKCFLLCLLSAISFVTTLSAQESKVPSSIPQALQEWVPWVLAKDPQRACARIGDRVFCNWPGSLSLALHDQGGAFTLSAAIDQHQFPLQLPGSSLVWPLDVQVQRAGEKVDSVLQNINGNPHVILNPGEYSISGSFSWTRIPEFLSVPEQIALIQLQVSGQAVKRFKRNENSELWLRESTPDKEEDRLSIHVHRKLADGNPFRVMTNLQLRVSGTPREVNLGRILFDGFMPVLVDSALPLRFDNDHGVTVQVKPGVFEVNIESLGNVAANSFSPPKSTLVSWPEKEFWVWEPNEVFRSVVLSGAAGVDPQNTTLPQAWHSLSAFVLGEGDSLALQETRRGQADVPPNQLRLRRTIWLDLNGAGATVQDQFTGEMKKSWRLNATSDFDLGHLSVSGKDQLITRDPQSELAGVELREQNLQLVAELRKEGGVKDFAAVGWDHDVSNLSVRLNLPPGWLLLDARGPDSVQQSWLSSWTLFDFFLLLLIAVVAGKLLGVSAGIVAGLSLILSHGVLNAPYQIWFHLLVAVALLSVLPLGRFRKLVTIYSGLTLIVLSLMYLQFTIEQVRYGLFPQLAQYYGGEVYPQSATFVGGMVNRMGEPMEAFQGASEDYLSEGSAYAPTMRSQAAGPASKAKSVYNLQQIDPNAVVQTGPGIPQWTWRTWELTWSGPVDKGERVSLYLLSPRMSMILSFLRVLLFGLFASYFFRQLSKSFIAELPFKRVPEAIVGACLLVLSLGYPLSASADSYPSPEMLEELKARLDETTCLNDCLSVSSVRFTIQGSRVILVAETFSRGAGTLAIPGPLDQFVPEKVLIDAVPTIALRRDAKDFVWVRVPEGSHRITVEGRLSERDTASLQFPLRPGHLSITSEEWLVDGITETGALRGSLELTRRGKKTAATSEQGPEELILPSWFFVERNLELGSPRIVRSVISRSGVADRPTVVKIPLLAGESVNADEVRVENGTAVVSFPRGVTRIEWASSLPEDVAEIELAAEELPYVSQAWNVACSSVFRCEYEGLAPQTSLSDGVHLMSWTPWPKESVKIKVDKPQGIAGAALTIDRVQTEYTPGDRILEGLLQATIRTSRGGFEKLKLPAKAEVYDVKINGVSKLIRPEDSELSIPLEVGSQEVSISWRVPWDVSFKQSMPALAFTSKAYNVTSTVKVPQNRWLLFVSGPSWGPAVLFWGLLLVVIAGALVLGRIQGLPVKTYQWVLLGLGVAALNVLQLLIIVGWFFAYRYRNEHPQKTWFKFNVLQLALGFLTFISFGIVYDAVQHGLILFPDMHIQGNNSHNGLLRWYTDSVAGLLPDVSFYSAPMWSYRVFMLLWSTWLVLSLVKWLPWAWSCFSNGGIWQSKPARISVQPVATAAKEVLKDETSHS